MAKEILIYDVIGRDWWTGGGITAKWFKRELDEGLKNNGEVTVRINSPGGDTGEGMAIYNLIAENAERVTTVNDGMAASMAADILMAGGTVKMAKNSLLMIHNASGPNWGNAKSMRQAADALDRFDTVLSGSFSDKSGKSIDTIKAELMDYQDHWMTAEEALEYGLADEVVNYAAKKTPENVRNMNHTQVMNWFIQNNAEPSGFLNRLAKKVQNIIKPSATNPATDNPETVASLETNDEPMKIKITNQMTAAAAVLGVTFAQGETEKETDVNAEQVTALLQALNTACAEKNTATEALNSEKNAHLSTQNELSALKEKTPAATTELPKDKGTDTVQPTSPTNVMDKYKTSYDIAEEEYDNKFPK